MRPESYREPEKRCGNCKHGIHVRWKDDRLCFFGDSIVVSRQEDSQGDFVQFNGLGVETMDGEEYSDVWGRHAVDEVGTCDMWESQEKKKVE